MKARAIVGLAGDPMIYIGDIVEGDEAVRLCEAGFAVPIIENAASERAAIDQTAAVDVEVRAPRPTKKKA